MPLRSTAFSRVTEGTRSRSGPDSFRPQLDSTIRLLGDGRCSGMANAARRTGPDARKAQSARRLRALVRVWTGADCAVFRTIGQVAAGPAPGQLTTSSAD